MKDRPKKLVLLALSLAAAFLCSCSSLSGTSACVISVIPLNPGGGWADLSVVMTPSSPEITFELDLAKAASPTLSILGPEETLWYTHKSSMDSGVKLRFYEPDADDRLRKVDVTPTPVPPHTSTTSTFAYTPKKNSWYLFHKTGTWKYTTSGEKTIAKFATDDWVYSFILLGDTKVLD